MTAQETDLVEAAEAARILGVERSTIRRYEERGRLTPADVRYEGLRRKPLFKRSDVEALRPPTEPSPEM